MLGFLQRKMIKKTPAQEEAGPEGPPSTSQQILEAGHDLKINNNQFDYGSEEQSDVVLEDVDAQPSEDDELDEEQQQHDLEREFKSAVKFRVLQEMKAKIKGKEGKERELTTEEEDMMALEVEVLVGEHDVQVRQALFLSPEEAEEQRWVAQTKDEEELEERKKAVESVDVDDGKQGNTKEELAEEEEEARAV